MATKTRQRSSKPRDVWGKTLEPLRFGDEVWRFSVPRKGQPTLYLDDLVDSFDWTEDQQSVLTGNLNVRLPTDRVVPLHVGQVVRAEWSHRGSDRWHPEWQMRVSQPSTQIRDGLTTYQLSDDLQRLSQSTSDFKYRRDKAHPNGWRGDQIIRDIAERYGVHLVTLPKMKHRFKKLVMTGVAPGAVIQHVLVTERTTEGNRFFLRWEDGLAFLPFQRSRELLVLAGAIIDGTYAESLPDGFATEVEVTAVKTTTTGRDSKGHRKKTKHREHVTVSSAAGIARYGRIHRKVAAPEHSADSRAELVAYGKRVLAIHGKPTRDMTLTHPGIPTLRRGHALRLTVPVIGLDQVIVFVSEIQHSVTSGDYTMDVTVGFDDPFADKTAKTAAKKRADKARKHNRRADTQPKKTYPQPKKNASRT